MCASMWFELVGGLFECQNLWYTRGKCENKEGDLNWAHPVPRVSGYKRGSHITEGGIRRFRVYLATGSQLVSCA